MLDVETVDSNISEDKPFNGECTYIQYLTSGITMPELYANDLIGMAVDVTEIVNKEIVNRYNWITSYNSRLIQPVLQYSTNSQTYRAVRLNLCILKQRVTLHDILK